MLKEDNSKSAFEVKVRQIYEQTFYIKAESCDHASSLVEAGFGTAINDVDFVAELDPDKWYVHKLQEEEITQIENIYDLDKEGSDVDEK